MKLRDFSSLPDLTLRDGSVCYHASYKSNSGTLYHKISWPRKMRKEELDLNDEEYSAWAKENLAAEQH